MLARAIADKDLDTVKFLVGRAEVNLDFDKGLDSCVLDTATMSSLELLKYVIKHGGADVNRPFKKGRHAGSALA